MFRKVDKKTESLIACVPLVIIVGMAVAAIIAKMVLDILGKKKPTGILCHWPSTLLALGILKKLITR